MPFAGAARRYWIGLFPEVCRERRRGLSRALLIPDARLREVALAALGKWGNVEGAVAFAAFVPRQRRVAAARAMMAFQVAYNYLDMLSERPGADPKQTVRALHGTLLAALEVDGDGACVSLEPGDRDRGEALGARADGGYLLELVESTRSALARLPAYPDLAEHALRAAQRIVEFQSANSTLGSTGAEREEMAALERWGREHTPHGSGLRWWETAAAGGSSLAVYALIALAACEPGGDLRGRAMAIDGAYFPWIGALHSLLDNLIDRTEDREAVQHNLIGCYGSMQEAAARMGMVAEHALEQARELDGTDGARPHALVLAAMASFYLATPESRVADARPVAEAVLDGLGGTAGLTMPVFRARLAARSLVPVGRGRARGAEIVPCKRAYRVHVREREA